MTVHNYATREVKFRAFRKTTNLKEVFIVRYADDFKIMCRSKRDAKRIFIAIKQWLKERLHLDISEEKSKIVYLNNEYSEFLGFKIKTRSKNNTRVITSHMSDKAIEKTIKDLKEQIKRIKRSPTTTNINKWNSMVLGKQNYYNSATLVNHNFSKIGSSLSKSLHNQMRKLNSYNGTKSETFIKYYGGYKFKTQYIGGIALFPIKVIKTKPSSNFSQDICDYTVSGRAKIHMSLLTVDIRILRNLMVNPIRGRSLEYNVNRISLYPGQDELCRITQIPLRISEMETHHITPSGLGGTDEYKNLAFIHSYAHKMVHSTRKETLIKYAKLLTKEIAYYNIDEYKSGKITVMDTFKDLIQKVQNFRIKAENFELN